MYCNSGPPNTPPLSHLYLCHTCGPRRPGPGDPNQSAAQYPLPPDDTNRFAHPQQPSPASSFQHILMVSSNPNWSSPTTSLQHEHLLMVFGISPAPLHYSGFRRPKPVCPALLSNIAWISKLVNSKTKNIHSSRQPKPVSTLHTYNLCTCRWTRVNTPWISLLFNNGNSWSLRW